jgi:hypothetical protein
VKYGLKYESESGIVTGENAFVAAIRYLLRIARSIISEVENGVAINQRISAACVSDVMCCDLTIGIVA